MLSTKSQSHLTSFTDEFKPLLISKLRTKWRWKRGLSPECRHETAAPSSNDIKEKIIQKHRPLYQGKLLAVQKDEEERGHSCYHWAQTRRKFWVMFHGVWLLSYLASEPFMISSFCCIAKKHSLVVYICKSARWSNFCFRNPRFSDPKR